MPGLDAFDRIFDFAEGVADGLSGKTDTRPFREKAPTGGSSVAMKVTVTEAIDAETGALVFIVKQGSNRAECGSSSFANHIAKLLRENG